MGSAWLCRAVGVGAFERLVVVKRPHPHISKRHGILERFMEEARVSASIHHANVIGSHHVGFDEYGPFIVLEYVEGASLEALLQHYGRGLPVSVALRIVLDALAGVHAVHTARDHSGRALKIIHRDISLQNLLIGVDGVCRVADFGAAKSELRSFSTDQRYLLGKLVYLPPEYLQRAPAEPTLDVYSLGITLWHALTGEHLWAREAEAQIVARIIEGDIPRVSERVTVPSALDELVAKATHIQAAERFRSADEMAQELERLAREHGCVATHSEVARFVKSQVGGELEQRRMQIAHATSSGDKQQRDPTLPTAEAKPREAAGGGPLPSEGLTLASVEVSGAKATPQSRSSSQQAPVGPPVPAPVPVPALEPNVNASQTHAERASVRDTVSVSARKWAIGGGFILAAFVVGFLAQSSVMSDPPAAHNDQVPAESQPRRSPTSAQPPHEPAQQLNPVVEPESSGVLPSALERSQTEDEPTKVTQGSGTVAKRTTRAKNPSRPPKPRSSRSVGIPDTVTTKNPYR
jgi:serine/threonine-protein kinase